MKMKNKNTKKVKSIDGFMYTKAIKKLRKLKKRIRVVPGGTSAGKTFGIIPNIIQYALRNPNKEISIVSESIPHLRKGAMKDFLKIMKITGRFNREQWKETTSTYTFKNGSYIEFFSVDNEEKTRGPRRHLLYINECNNIKFETYHQLAIRTSEIIWLDFNPSEEFWVHENLDEDEDAEWLILTYKDNEALPNSIVKEIEKALVKGFYNPSITDIDKLFHDSNIKSSFWANWWKVYGLGLIGKVEGLIFKDWKIVKGIPKNAKYLGCGVDFGKGGKDPTTTMALWEYDGKLIWDEVIYQSQLLDGEHIKLLKQSYVDQYTVLACDNSEPSKILELKNAGFNAKGTRKETIDYGIGLMQQREFYVTQRSINFIKELRGYKYDDNGKPIGIRDHAIDGARYLMVELFGINKNQTTRGFVALC